MTPQSLSHRTFAAALLALPLLACGVDSQDSTDVDALAAELPTIDQLVDDAQYMREIFEENDEPRAVSLDLGDDRQYQFLVNRLRSAGLSPATAPELFDRVERARFRAMNDLVPRDGGDRCDMFITTEDAPEGTLGTIGRASCVDGSDYSLLQVCHYDDLGNLLDCSVEEQFGAGITADVVTQTITDYGTADGLSYHVTSQGEEFYYYAMALTTTTVPTLRLNMAHPADLTNSGGIQLCLERNTWSTDCDYKHATSGACSGNSLCNNVDQPQFPVFSPGAGTGSGTYNDNRLYMPLQTSTTFSHTVPVGATINSARAWLTLQSSGDSTPAGGLCTADFTSSPYLAFAPLSNTFKKLVINPFALDIGNAVWPDHCVDHRVAVDLHVEVEVQTGATARLYSFNSGANGGTMSIAWGCLPPGTPITLADGTEVAIERIVPGDKVMADDDGGVLTVVDVMSGLEEEPLVVVEDSLGHVVSMTVTHPVPTLGRGALEARELVVGDEIETDDGIAYVVSVSRKAYDGEVYNLVLGTPEELEARGQSTTMVANHMVVGDARMQGLVKAERSATAQTDREQAPVPAELYVDYVGAQLRGLVRSLQG
jgi:hypothetical protein